MFDKLISTIVLNKLIKKGEKSLDKLETDSHNAKQIANDLLFRIIRDNTDTEYGKKYHFSEIHTIEDFKRLVPFSTYDDYAPYIERMIQKNETNLISSYPTMHYALSSGSVGVPKHIPVSQETLNIYSSCGAARILASAENYYKKKYGKKFPRGKGLNLTEVRLAKTENGVPKGAISGVAVASQKRFLKYIFTSPNQVIFPEEVMDMKYMKARYALADKDIVFITAAFMTAIVDLMNYMRDNWELLCDDIENGKIDKSIIVSCKTRGELEKKIKPDKARANELRKIFREGFDRPIIPKIWPRMTWISAIGTGGFASYTEKMRGFAGDNVYIDFSIYAASESLMAMAKEAEKMEYALIPRACYFEFIPTDSEDEETTYGLDELEIGKDYEIVLTNLSGFYRYKIKDVVKVKGYYSGLPLITFLYRKNQMISIAGEKTNDESVGWAVQEFSKQIHKKIMNYAIYADTDCEPGRYIMLIEPDEMLDIKDLPKYRDILDEKLGYANPSYGKKVKEGVLSKMVLHYSQIETHAAYRDLMVMKGISDNQLKPVRVLDTPRKEGFFLKLIEDEHELEIG